MKTVMLNEEIAPRHFRMEMYAGDAQRISMLLAAVPTAVVWECNGGSVVDDGSSDRYARALFTLNDGGGDGEVQLTSTYADGTRRKAIIEVKALASL